MATRKSTNINELPSLNSMASQNDDDDAIAEVLEEIQNENNALESGPQPPLETMPQGPTRNNIPGPMQHPMQQQNPMQNQNINQMPPQQFRQRPVRMISQQVPVMSMGGPPMDQNIMQQNVLDQLKSHLLTENFVDKKQKQYDNRAVKFIDDMKSNSSLIVIILLSYIFLQNASIRNILLARFESFNIPYLDVIIIGLTQVILIFLFKNFV
jgi:hypothetical protein|tara:strand:+ start:6076 stop:6708 length:633 start_codon:yes stop_codon:yes gene_type:complete